MENAKHESERDSTSVKTAVLSRIASGAKMKPRWHYVLRAVLTLVGTLIVAAVVLYVISFTFFVLRQTGALYLPSFGLRGLGVFLLSLPWLLVFGSIIFVILLEILVQHYAFAYKTPLLYSLTALIFLVSIGSIAVAQFGVHDSVFRFAEKNNVPLAHPFYRGFTQSPSPDVHPCNIREISDEGIIVMTPDGESVRVILTSETRFPRGFNFEAGDRILIMGKRDGETINAYGIRPFEPQRSRGPVPLRFMPMINGR